MGEALLALGGGIICLVLYLLKLNWVLSHTPQEVVDRAGEPLTREYIKDVFERVKKDGIDWEGKLPPRKDRRYIVVGGSGFLGGQIILHLLAMGTPPEAIRILDARRPFAFSKEFSQGAPSKVAYIQTDITNEAATIKSYSAPWPEAVAGLPLTVFHTAAVIRPFDRYKMIYERTSRVNVTGTVHSLQAAKKAGASVFIYTSSSNAALKQVKWLFAPWGATQQPKGFIQNLSNEDFFEPLQQPHEFPTNYAQSKAEAERLVCGADEADVGAGVPALRTGVIRPGNPVYGHKDDNVSGRMLRIGWFPSWVPANVQNWINVKNASLAHLQYEDALLGEHGGKVAGRPFIVTDKGKPVRFQDIYTILNSVSVTGFEVSYPPPMLMLMLSYVVEWYALLINAVPLLGKFLSEPGEDLRWLQPGVHATSLHYFIDDSEAKKKPADGGIGYTPCCTTVEGVCSQVVDWNAWVEEEGKMKK
ncbi:short-chain dehydrogenase/reductase family 42E member 1 [Trichoderma asperellum]|uniref:Short-chain dehydrogenase/reductase family 42E member 1 n=1 Tax=Trichoderma asperellum TaxID=101201 RepID=A0A6V8QIR0_TRIAP|nr:NAD(P)-binding protein [Trichoderma asperelloides]GFP52364.1 short-chain dehydrogenase/reductase family 42E member 1 [Trichoderma asperellum]